MAPREPQFQCHWVIAHPTGKDSESASFSRPWEDPQSGGHSSAAFALESRWLHGKKEKVSETRHNSTTLYFSRATIILALRTLHFMKRMPLFRALFNLSSQPMHAWCQRCPCSAPAPFAASILICSVGGGQFHAHPFYGVLFGLDDDTA